MSSTTFHRFPDLPYELRHLIWKHSLRPTEGKSGLHYLAMSEPGNLNNMRDIPNLRFHLPSISSATSVDTRPRSAFLWDAGLWTACKESRQVIMKHFEMDYWIPERKEISREFQIWWHTAHKFLDDWYGPCPSYPFTATVHGDHECKLLVRPLVDVFCLTSSNLEIQSVLPLLHNCWSALIITHIAFEFDKSWFINLPAQLWDLLRERSPRGVVANLLKGFYELRNDEVPCRIYLIDRDSRWRAGPLDYGRRLAFYDCDQEFVQVDCEDKHLLEEYENLLEECDDDSEEYYSLLEECERTAVRFVDRLCMDYGSEFRYPYDVAYADLDPPWDSSNQLAPYLHVFTCTKNLVMK
ncbi:hypothetical protein F66182_724 [Fusarium sp. NRRL 66182]|nr:hypothetical protein F66182_724 [Fusarium sp. NRRL 66182]